jgi:hypothetical protein
MINTPRWAVTSGVAGLVANALLILFYVLARPWAGEWSEYAWLGPANDLVVAVQFAALVPVALAVHAALGGRIGGFTATGVTAMVAATVLQLALVAGLVDFDVEVYAVVMCLAVVFAWMLAASVAGRSVLAPAAVRLGTLAGLGFLAGLAVAALGLLLPEGPARYAAWVVGGLAGLAGWLAFPVWPLALVRRVRVRPGAVAA